MAVEVTDYRGHKFLSGKDAQNSFFEPQHAFLRDRTVFLVRLNKNGSQKRDKGMPGPLTIEVQAQLKVTRECALSKSLSNKKEETSYENNIVHGYPYGHGFNGDSSGVHSAWDIRGSHVCRGNSPL